MQVGVSFNFFQNAGLQNGRDHWQWQAVDRAGQEYFMLNTDFEIFFDLELDGNGQTICTLDNSCIHKHTCGRDGLCPKAATFDQALSYAHVSLCLLCFVQWILCTAIRFVTILLKAKQEVYAI